MRKYFFLCLIALGALCSSLAAERDKWCAEVSTIDNAIQELQNRRIGELGKAARYEDEAIRWQTRPGQFNEMRRAYDQAAAARKEADKVQTEIDQLHEKKYLILQKHANCQ